VRAADWLYREALSDGPNELGRTVARALAVCGGLANDASIDAVTRAAIEAARGYFVERTMERSAFLATLEDVTLEFTSGTEAPRNPRGGDGAHPTRASSERSRARARGSHRAMHTRSPAICTSRTNKRRPGSRPPRSSATLAAGAPASRTRCSRSSTTAIAVSSR